MELSNRGVLVVQVVMSLVAWSAIAVALWRPLLAKMERRRALRWVLAPQMLRHVGMSLLATGVAGAGMPAAFAESVATGDLVTAIVSVAAFVALGRDGRGGIVLAAVATTVGAVDLMRNMTTGIRIGAADHLGAAWPVVAMIVPGMLVLHVAALALIAKAPVRGTS